jgi:hypothetical protein
MSELVEAEPRDVTEVDLRRTAQISTVVNELAKGRSLAQACEKAGICERTWRYWRSEGLTQPYLDDAWRDLTDGLRGIVQNNLIRSMLVLADIAQGIIPRGTAITGTLAPRDVVAASQQLQNIYQKLGGDKDVHDRAQERLLEELMTSTINITTVHIETVNRGDEAQPMPVAIGVRQEGDVIDGDFTVSDDDE